MYSLFLSLFAVILIAILVARFGFRRAGTFWRLVRYGLVSVMSAFILLLIGIAFLLSGRLAQEATSLPIFSDIEDALRAEQDGNPMVLQGRLSEESERLNDTGYVAYVRSAEDEDDVTYELPDLMMALDGGTVIIDRGIYEQYSWKTDSQDTAQSTRFLLPNDEVIVYGRGYLEGSEHDEEGAGQLYLSAPFVFAGSAEEYTTELKPSLQRQELVTRLGGIISFIAAIIVLLSPIPTGLDLLRSR